MRSLQKQKRPRQEILLDLSIVFLRQLTWVGIAAIVFFVVDFFAVAVSLAIQLTALGIGHHTVGFGALSVRDQSVLPLLQTHRFASRQLS